MPEACSFEGCDRARESRGLCLAHYKQMRKGKGLKPLRVTVAPVGSPCTFDDCEKPVRGRGLCAAHHKQLMKGRELTPLTYPISDLAEKLRAYSEDTAAGCRVWTGATVRGYGSVHHQGATRVAHRLAYELEKGAIPDHLVLNHICRNTACINTEHLEAVTHAQNLQCAVWPTEPTRGAWWDSYYGIWRSGATKDGEFYSFGSFNSQAGAVEAAAEGRERIGMHNPKLEEENAGGMDPATGV